MSLQAITWAMRQKVGGASGKLVLIVLAEFADSGGRCFPSQETIAERSELKIRAVRDWLVKLQQHGFIERARRYRDGGYRTSDEIRLRIDDQQAANDAAEDAHEPILPANGAADILPADFAGSAFLPANDDILTGSKCRVTCKGNLSDTVRKTRARKTALRSDWKASEAERSYALKQKLPEADIDGLQEDFLNYWIGKGEPMADWTRTWQRWCRTEAQRRSRFQPKHINGHANSKPKGRTIIHDFLDDHPDEPGFERWQSH
jgi:hypothetical protein